MALVIEIVSRSGRSLERHSVRSHSATIGRGYDNDIIVSDPYMEAHHVRVSRNGGILTVDPVDPGGRTLHGRAIIDGPTELESGEVLTLGRTRVRLLTSEHPVEPSLPLRFIDELFAWLAQPTNVVIGVVLFVALIALNQYQSQFVDLELSDFLVELITPLLAYLTLAIGWAFVSRIFRHEPRFFFHCWASITYLVFVLITDWLIRTLSFNTNDLQLTWWSSTVRDGIAMFILFSLNLRFAFQLSDFGRRSFAFGIAMTIMGFSALSYIARTPDFNPRPRFVTVMLPDTFLFRSGIEVEEFVTDAQVIFDFEDELAGNEHE